MSEVFSAGRQRTKISVTSSSGRNNVDTLVRQGREHGLKLESPVNKNQTLLKVAWRVRDLKEPCGLLELRRHRERMQPLYVKDCGNATIRRTKESISTVLSRAVHGRIDHNAAPFLDVVDGLLMMHTYPLDPLITHTVPSWLFQTLQESEGIVRLRPYLQATGTMHVNQSSHSAMFAANLETIRIITNRTHPQASVISYKKRPLTNTRF